MTLRATLHDQRPSLVVATLGAAFGTALITVLAGVDAILENAPSTASSHIVPELLAVLGPVFFCIAAFIGGVVTANTFAASVAMRTRTIALLRLLGSSARSQRRVFLREGATIGLIGSALGSVLGIGLAFAVLAVVAVSAAAPFLPPAIPVTIAFPFVAVIAVTVVAAWNGSREVLTVTPIQALGAAEEAPLGTRRRPVRTVLAALLFVVGNAVIVLGVLQGLQDFRGVLITLLGGLASFSGVILGAHAFLPRALHLVGRLFGSTPEASLAQANALRNPERSTRATSGVLIGVTVVAAFSVALATFRGLLDPAIATRPDYYIGLDEVLAQTSAIGLGLVAFSAAIACVGVISDLSISVVQRTHEIGLLRALGFTRRQVRRTIVLEAAAMSITATLLGLALGAAYGWVGALSFIGSLPGVTVVGPVVPLALVVGLALVTAALTATAAIIPAKRAVSVTPVEALKH